jgi:broad specificity phosphatase PhoE
MNDVAELWLVRHGETEWSASGRHTSRTDLELTPDGRKQASGLPERLGGQEFARVLSSPRRRAVETAELAGLGERVELIEDLAEWFYGDDEGRTTAQIREDRPGWTVWREGPAGGESADDVGRRADQVIALARAADGPVIAFTHGHFARVLGARWVGLDAAGGAHLILGTGALCVLGEEHDTPGIRLWNDTGHID